MKNAFASDVKKITKNTKEDVANKTKQKHILIFLILIKNLYYQKHKMLPILWALNLT